MILVGIRMKFKVITGIVWTLLLIGMLTLAFNIQLVKASGTIYIRADGSIEPLTANITTVDNVTYTFTDNIYDSIVVERSNIIIDGDGYTLQYVFGGPIYGLYLYACKNVTIKETDIEGFDAGIYLYWGASFNILFEQHNRQHPWRQGRRLVWQ